MVSIYKLRGLDAHVVFADIVVVYERILLLEHQEAQAVPEWPHCIL